MRTRTAVEKLRLAASAGLMASSKYFQYVSGAISPASLLYSLLNSLL
jgi:hypothetical protein